MRYAIVIEKLESNYSVYVPDLPGCVATGATLEEMEQQIKEAIAFHLDGLREEGLPIPEPTPLCEYVVCEAW
ncbi:type II toxin-antitoxin system HicB family antitoxin [Coleofasciculus sp. FACHB-1120]|uniref:type II toxin-antitoxin system HicB family antitoxin n=1 Tax=Coleofasciculus sp. FACHB-1120 TaxID=2692783 RepID=UPI0016897B34|nr:type II toxin-antitoxin system HicB family antitoxin [Coleofasciculus sp. FACHB-1120]MBD2742435.1 type II toxin-antitoxin system HicB family antitoxin [Coleofasciculus sp. FACHB-1120]